MNHIKDLKKLQDELCVNVDYQTQADDFHTHFLEMEEKSTVHI